MDNTIATLLGAGMGALLTGPITYYFTNKLFERQKFEAAASKFRADIIQALKGYYPIFTKMEWGVEPLKERLPDVLGAFSEFHFFVENKLGFEIAMNEYIMFCEKYQSSFNLSANRSLPLQSRYHKRVHDLLSFSNPPKSRSWMDIVFNAAPKIRLCISNFKKKVCS